MTSELALFGGPKAIQNDPADLFRWPIITPEIEEAVLAVLRAGAMSGIDVTMRFEEEYAAWHGMSFALAHNTGTAALHAAMFGLGIGHGDEIICPSITYWASCAPVYSLGGTVVFADIDPQTLCIDPDDIEHRISPRTKAILVVHYTGYPADMDRIMEIARRRKIAVIEDVSHAHGARYKGRLVGTIGDVSAASIMSGKSLAAGEGGVLLTNDRRIYERAMIFGHYERANKLTLDDLTAGAGLPWGGDQVSHAPTDLGDGSRAAPQLCGPDGRDRSGDELLLGHAGGDAGRARSPAASRFRPDDGRLVRGHRPLSAGGVGRAVGAAFLPGAGGRGRAVRAGLQQGAAPAPALQHRRCLRPGQAHPHREPAGRAWISASRRAACRSPKGSRSASSSRRGSSIAGRPPSRNTPTRSARWSITSRSCCPMIPATRSTAASGG